MILVGILLVIPATNATSERTFSALHRVKTDFQSTMTHTQSRLNSLYIQNALDLKEIANEFTAKNERNRCVWEVLVMAFCVSSSNYVWVLYKNYVLTKIVVFLVVTFIYFLCPTTNSLRNLLVKTGIFRKLRDSQDATKSLLETMNRTFFPAKIPKHPHTTSLRLN